MIQTMPAMAPMIPDVIGVLVCRGSLSTVAVGLGLEVRLGVAVVSVALGRVPSPRAKTTAGGLKLPVVPMVTPNVLLLFVEKSKKSASEDGFETAAKEEMLACPRSMGRS